MEIQLQHEEIKIATAIEMENTANSRAKLCNKTFVVLLKIVPRQLLFKQYTCKWLQVFFSCIYQSFTELFHMLLCQWIIQGDAAFGNYRNAFITRQPRRTRHFWCITSMQSEFAPLLHSGRQLRSRGPSPSPSSWKLNSKEFRADRRFAPNQSDESDDDRVRVPMEFHKLIKNFGSNKLG